MSQDGGGIIGAFRPNDGAITIHCESFSDFKGISGNMRTLYQGGQQKLETLNPRELLMRTGLHHELRHYHDFMLSYDGYEIFRRSIQLTANGYYFLHILSSDESDYLAYPLTELGMAPSEKKEQFLAGLRDFYDIESDRVYLPQEVSLEALESTDLSTYENSSSHQHAHFQVCLRDALTVRDMFRVQAPEDLGGLSSQDVYELSAMARQMLALFELIEPSVALSVTEETLRNSYYGKILNLLKPLLQGLEVEQILRLQMLIATYAIAATPPASAEAMVYSMSHFRFIKLVHQLKDLKSELKLRMRQPEKLFLLFSELMEEPIFQERLDSQDKFFAERFEDTRRQFQSSTEGRNQAFDSKLIALQEQYQGFRVEQTKLISENYEEFLEGGFEGNLAQKTTFPPIVVDTTRIQDRTVFEENDLQDFAENSLLTIYLSDELSENRQNIETYMPMEHLVSNVFNGTKLTTDSTYNENLEKLHRDLVKKKRIRYM